LLAAQGGAPISELLPAALSPLCDPANSARQTRELAGLAPFGARWLLTQRHARAENPRFGWQHRMPETQASGGF
jgi:hypothetical protein